MKIYKERKRFRPLIIELMTQEECNFMYALMNGPGMEDLERWLPAKIKPREALDFKEDLCDLMRKVNNEEMRSSD